MALEVLTQAALIEKRKANAKKVTAQLFEGGMVENKDSKAGPVRAFSPKTGVENNISELEELRYKIVSNAAQAPAAADIEAFFGKFFIDVTRRAMEAPDLTSFIANEVTNFEFPEIVSLRDVEKFRGIMGIVSGANDGVNLIEQNTGNVDTLTMKIRAVGWKDSLKNMLYNKWFTMDKVVQAAVDADVDARNAATVGMIVGATYAASQKQAANAVATYTLDEKTYATIQAAEKLLRGLNDIQTDKKISVPSISILCNSADTWQIENVIRGQLNGNGSTARTSNRPALPITQVIEYDRGINDGFVIGKVTASFPGVTAGKCYMFIPGVLVVANKRPLTMETGRGSVLELSTEERSWYRVQGENSKAFLGSSYPGTTIGAGYGAIVEITLPS